MAEEDKSKSELGKLKPIDLLAASAAAATATIIGGKLGIAGTVIGAATASAVTTIAVASYKTLGHKAKHVAKKVTTPITIRSVGVHRDRNGILVPDFDQPQPELLSSEVISNNLTVSNPATVEKVITYTASLPDDPQPDSPTAKVIIEREITTFAVYDDQTVVLPGQISATDQTQIIAQPTDDTQLIARTADQNQSGLTSETQQLGAIARVLRMLGRNWERILILILVATMIGIGTILFGERISGRAWTPGTSAIQRQVTSDFPRYIPPTVIVVTESPKVVVTQAPTITVTPSISGTSNPAATSTATSTTEAKKPDSGNAEGNSGTNSKDNNLGGGANDSNHDGNKSTPTPTPTKKS